MVLIVHVLLGNNSLLVLSVKTGNKTKIYIQYNSFIFIFNKNLNGNAAIYTCNFGAKKNIQTLTNKVLP